MGHGILPRQDIEQLVEMGAITGLSDDPAHPPSIQPASLDLCLGDTAMRLRASFLPGAGVGDGLCLCHPAQRRLKPSR